MRRVELKAHPSRQRLTGIPIVIGIAGLHHVKAFAFLANQAQRVVPAALRATDTGLGLGRAIGAQA